MIEFFMVTFDRQFSNNLVRGISKGGTKKIGNKKTWGNLIDRFDNARPVANRYPGVTTEYFTDRGCERTSSPNHRR